MQSNSKEVQLVIRQHILDCVCDNNEELFTTFENAAKHLHEDFNRVTNNPYNRQKFPIDENRFMDYMQGLPFSFLYWYCDIHLFLESLKINNSGNYTDDKSQKFYCYLIYTAMIKSVNKIDK